MELKSEAKEQQTLFFGERTIFQGFTYSRAMTLGNNAALLPVELKSHLNFALFLTQTHMQDF